MSYEFADGYKVRDQSAWHFMTFTVVGWIDLFSRKVYRDILIDNMRYCCEKKGLAVGAFVIMTNHVHVIWKSEHGKLSDLLRDFKSYTTKQIIAVMNTIDESREDWLLYMFEFYAKRTNQNKEFKIWTSNNHPEMVESMEFLKSKLKYIHENPVRAGWVKEPEEYIYSSASNYKDGTGLIDVRLLL